LVLFCAFHNRCDRPNLTSDPSSPRCHSPAQPLIPITLQDALAIMDELPRGLRHLGFALDPLYIQILGALVRPVFIRVQRLAQGPRPDRQSLMWSP
jgi:hypothetical protein